MSHKRGGEYDRQYDEHYPTIGYMVNQRSIEANLEKIKA